MPHLDGLGLWAQILWADHSFKGLTTAPLKKDWANPVPFSLFSGEFMRFMFKQNDAVLRRISLLFVWGYDDE